jgi:nucleoside-diphosphate-sugar epimerase
MHAAMRGCDAVFHAPARYEVGLPEREADAMDEANVRGTVNVLDAAAEVPLRAPGGASRRSPTSG